METDNNVHRPGRVADARVCCSAYLRLNEELATSRGQVFASPTWVGRQFDGSYRSEKVARAVTPARSHPGDSAVYHRALCYMLCRYAAAGGDYAGAADLFAEAAPLIDTKDALAARVGMDVPRDMAVDEGQYERAAQLVLERAAPLPGVGFRHG